MAITSEVTTITDDTQDGTDTNYPLWVLAPIRALYTHTRIGAFMRWLWFNSPLEYTHLNQTEQPQWNQKKPASITTIVVAVAVMIVVARTAGIATPVKTANTTMNQTASGYQPTSILITQQTIIKTWQWSYYLLDYIHVSGIMSKPTFFDNFQHVINSTG